MVHRGNKAPTVLHFDAPVPLESVLCTEELHRRPSRSPDYEKENRALLALVQSLAHSPQAVLQALANTILTVFQADSAGISLLTKDEKSFYWPAIAGVWYPHTGGGTPRHFGPCGDVLDRNAPLLFKHFERRYTYLQHVTPPVEECLLVPFYVGEKAVGTIWAIAHNAHRTFDAEDLRQLVSLGRFASAAYEAVTVLDVLEPAPDSRLAALNLMEDAVQARQATERLNGALRASEERYRTLFESIDEGCCIIERVDGEAGEPLDFRYVVVNPAFAAQSGVTDVVGKTVREVVPGESEDWFLTYDTVLRTGEPTRFERELVTQGRVLELYAFRVDDDTQQRVAVIFRDVTARKKAEAEVRESGQRKDEFLAMLAHELRNPLAPIRNALEIMRRRARGIESSTSAPPADPILEMLERQVGQMVRLVDDLLDAGRISRGLVKLRPERVELSSVVHHVVDTVRPLCEGLTHDLTVTLPPEPVYVDADPTRLMQIVGNLLNNACKFTDRGGRIWLTVAGGEEVVIRVRDTGIGIAADELPRVFEMFTQVNTSLGRSGSGLGIGLTLVRTLAELHGGTVEARSAGVGEGSEFVVRLPIVVDSLRS